MKNICAFGCGLLAGIAVSLLIDFKNKKADKVEQTDTEDDCPSEESSEELEKDFINSVKLKNIKNKQNVIDYLAAVREQRYSMENHSDEEVEFEGSDDYVETDEEHEDTGYEFEEDYPETGEEVIRVKHKVNAGIPPKVISPEEFGELDDYDMESLIYFSDGYLTDTDYKLIKDVEDLVGSDSLKQFGEFEVDSVFVRNENYDTDYEILLDQRKYEEVSKKVPKPHEV